MLYSTRRHGSDPSKTHPLSKVVCKDATPIHLSQTVSQSHTPVHPYSSVSGDMGLRLSSMNFSGSCYVHSANDRYQKFDSGETYDCSNDKGAVDNLSSNTCGKDSELSPFQKRQNIGTSQEDRIASIRDDIGRFSKSSVAAETIPTVSSRWSKFMTESEDKEGEDGEDEDRERGEEGGEIVHMHMLQSKRAVAKYS